MVRDRAQRSSLRLPDLAGIALRGGRTSRLGAALSGIGIALGSGAVVAVLGLAASSEATIVDNFNQVSTLLSVTTEPFGGTQVAIPGAAMGMVRRIGPVVDAAGVALLGAAAYRTDLVPTEESNGLEVVAADRTLAHTVDASVQAGAFLAGDANNLPVTVLGAVAAERLGIDRPGDRVWVGGRWFYVVGVLAPVVGAPELDAAVMVGLNTARTYLGYSGGYTELYVRTYPGQTAAVAAVLPATVLPGESAFVNVTEASGVANLQTETTGSLNGLVLGLGSVSFLVGGLGVMNVMTVSVLERRNEIAIRRALGARRRHIGLQFLAESVLLSSMGGVIGAAAGVVAAVGFSTVEGWVVAIPWYGFVGAVAAAALVGSLAGVYPALRAASVAPSEVLRSM